MKVVFTSATRGKVRQVGIIYSKQGKLVADPADSEALRTVLKTPVRGRDGRRVDASSPDVFLAALPATYRGSYFSAAAVGENSDEGHHLDEA